MPNISDCMQLGDDDKIYPVQNPLAFLSLASGLRGRSAGMNKAQRRIGKRCKITRMEQERATSSLAALCFRVVIGLSLAFVMLCALLPTNAVHPRNVGSAFDPSTTILALNHRADDGAAHNRFVVKKPDHGGTPDVGPGVHLVPIFALACALILMLALRAVGSVQAPLGPPQPLSAHAQRPHGPRGPPQNRL